MRTLFCFLCIASSANAGILAQFAYFGPTSAPNNLSVELRTVSNDLVRWETSNLSPINDYRVLVADVNTAAGFGVDWNAWAAAVINADYNRILFTFGGVTIEKSWPLRSSGRNNYTTLGKLELYVNNWQSAQPQVELVARDTQVTPEPTSWLMLLAIGFHLFSGYGWHSRSRRAPCRR